LPGLNGGGSGTAAAVPLLRVRVANYGQSVVTLVKAW